MLRSLLYWLRGLADPPVCRVVFTAAGVRCTRGAPPPAWLADCSDVGRELGLHRGTLDVLDRDGRLQLRFSPDLPAASHQRLRNVLGVRLAGLRQPRRR